MSLVWVYHGNEYKRVSDLNPNQVMLMINNSCDGIRQLVNYVINNVLSVSEYRGVTARIYRGNDEHLIHFFINLVNGNEEVMILVSRNPADTLFNYYTSASPENIIECSYGK
ncbi:hypothetical protein VMUT_2308 [Vulcanisaeta moutnovskia 768-28]|uniref:Uncharacterized protein n=1 Tax=Vulcanisaeta moutnovskia (strain 768-28) TaxID=985053 RepID=F0QY15_VULM7|nr:hypothetical protein [Vulcanisaeta moutnovskia]ADY02501.1 hypothetical protein VMUT_2308 [Vulcanisaeta moutnovskia 768-28]